MRDTFSKHIVRKKNNEIIHIITFNDTSVKKDKRLSAKRIRTAKDQREYWAIEDVLLEGAKSFIHTSEFDTVEMELYLGLIYNKTIENREVYFKPIKEIVRYYTGKVKSYLDEKLVNESDNDKILPINNGYIDYSFLIESAKNNGLQFIGPESFQEFEQAILSKKPFKIKLVATLTTKKQTDNNPKINIKK